MTRIESPYPCWMGENARRVIRLVLHDGDEETPEMAKLRLEERGFPLLRYRNCGPKTAGEIIRWTGTSLPLKSPTRKKRSTIEWIREKLSKAVLSKAKNCQHALVAEMPEADSYAIFVFQPDGTFRGEGYAEGLEWKDLRMYELAYILEYGEDKPCKSN